MILVTGAAGFIGSVIVKHLNDLGNENLLLCDHFEQGDKWKNLKGLKYSSFVQVEDLFTHEIWKKAGSLKAIYHMGACSDTTELNMDFLYKNNTEYTTVAPLQRSRSLLHHCYRLCLRIIAPKLPRAERH